MAEGTASAVSDTPQVCSETGLSLVRWPLKGAWRVFRTSKGALLGRIRESEDPKAWNRFDLPGRATLYLATERRGAYAEVLAPMRPRLEALADLAHAELNEGDEPVPLGSDPITDEWAERGHMLPGGVPQIWRHDRSIAQLDVTSVGWFVDVEAQESLSALRTSCAQTLLDHGVDDLDVSVIRGPNRRLTCALAEFLESIVLFDGSYPLGIRYMSRLATAWECWAVFPDTDVVERSSGGLLLSDADLMQVANDFRLHLHGS